jgi:hypothetical protein
MAEHALRRTFFSAEQKLCCCLESDADIVSKGKSGVSIFFVVQTNLISAINTKLTQKRPLNNCN